ncbi:hypothetical protein GCM10009678_54220 [Actinomadura kijaniata]
MVIAAIGVDHRRPAPGSSDLAADGRDRRQKRKDLGDVVAVATGQGDGQGDAAAVADQVVFGARSAAVDRARPGFGPPRSARTCELSITARDQSI